MKLPVGLKWLCTHRWRQTSRFVGDYNREWVCLDCRKRTVRWLNDPPYIYIPPGESGDPFSEVVDL